MENNKLISGVNKKNLQKHHDERGFFEEIIRSSDEFFQEGFGQLSHSRMKKGVIKAWHIHRTQIDWWFVSSGKLKVALYDLRSTSATFKRLNVLYLGTEADNIVLKIPAGVAHGCKPLTEETELFYVTSKIYNPQEEGRLPHDDPGINYDWLKD